MTIKSNQSDTMTEVSTKQKSEVWIKISVLVMVFGSIVLAGGIFFSFYRLVTPKKVVSPISVCPTITVEQLVISDSYDTYLQKMKTSDCSSSLVTREGILYVIIADNFENEKSERSYVLYSNGETTSLYFSGTSDQPLKHGNIISVTGYLVNDGGGILLDVEDISISADKTENPQAPIIGTQETLTVRGIFEGYENYDSIPHLSAVRDSMIYVDNYYFENSYGVVDFKGAVNPDKPADNFGAYVYDFEKPSEVSSEFCAQLSDVMDYMFINVADYLDENEIVDLAQYDQNGKLAIIAPMGCWWGGLGGGHRQFILSDGSSMDIDVILINTDWDGQDGYLSATSLPVPIAHEFGHSFGHDHAAFYGCNIFSLPFDPENCEYFNEYGDRFDVMGNLGVNHYNAKHKQESGWFTDWDQNTGEGRRALVTEQTVTDNGIYTLEPIETNTNGLKALMIPRVDEEEYLYVEFRQLIGFDSGMGGWPFYNNIYNGALLHIDAGWLDTYYGPANFSYLFMPDGIEAIYSYRNEGYPALEVGASFNDPESYTTVSVEAIYIDEDNPENSRLTVKIIFNDIPTDIGDACIDGTPSGQCDMVGDYGRLCIDGAFVESDCLVCDCPNDYACDMNATGGPICIQGECTDTYESEPNIHPGTCTDASGTYGGMCVLNDAYEYYCTNGSGNIGVCEQRQYQTCSAVCSEGVCTICLEDSDCRDADGCTFDVCNNPGEIDAFCSNEQAPNTCGDRECGIYGCSDCGTCSTGELCNDGYCELTCSDGTISGQCNQVGDSGQLCNDGTLEDSDCQTCGCPSIHSCTSGDGVNYACHFDESYCITHPDYYLCPDTGIN
ncbi:MAG: hypothetical protein ACNFW9_04595 [Candidatus Kerfeldbacteria bacterium]